MENKKIYVVLSVGGQYEDRWQYLECAFTNKESAQEYVDSKLEKKGKITRKKYNEIKKYLLTFQDAIYDKYFNEDCSAKFDNSEEMYDKEEDEFINNKTYTIIKDVFGYDKDEFDEAESDFISDFSHYIVKEVTLFN